MIYIMNLRRAAVSVLKPKVRIDNSSVLTAHISQAAVQIRVLGIIPNIFTEIFLRTIFPYGASSIVHFPFYIISHR